MSVIEDLERQLEKNFNALEGLSRMLDNHAFKDSKSEILEMYTKAMKRNADLIQSIKILKKHQK